MPTKNSIKNYIKDGYYHIYNRGVEKRNIFEDAQDYKTFLKYLKQYLSPPPKPTKIQKDFTLKGTTFKGVPKQPKNYHKKVELYAFCLMPNHFHLLLKQKVVDSMEKLLKSLTIRYSMYFNKRYDRVGQLFQGRYKAVNILDEAYLLHLSRYIHLNPMEYTPDIVNGAYSSYANYLGLRSMPWVKTKLVLSFFNKATIPEVNKYNNYKDFTEKYLQESDIILDKLIIE